MNDNNGYLPLPKGFATSAIHFAHEPQQWSFKDVVPPITMSTVFKETFTTQKPGSSKSYKYGRLGNPTRDVLEKVIANLEGGKYGSCFGSGQGASTAVLGLLKQGDHVVCSDDIYGGTNILLTKIVNKFGIKVTFVDNEDVDSFEKALQPETKMIWIESPSNPTMKICDIEAISKVAKKHNSLLVVDNTFLTPYFQKPLALGADIVVHSLTKYMNGHADVIMGAVVVNDEKLSKEIGFFQCAVGIIPSPFDCYLVLRGLKTLPLRMNHHAASSLRVAKHLEKHPKVEKVLHPGLESHPQFELTKKQTSGHSGIMSIYIKGNADSPVKFMESLKVFTLAGSLGGHESVVGWPSKMSHGLVSQEQKDRVGIHDNLIRLSIGLEDTEDLIADLNQALSLI